MPGVQPGDAARAGQRGVGIPTPVVTGPVPSDPPGSPGRNYPFLATDVDIAGRGYVEAEFFYSGTANWYDAPVPTVNSDPPFPVAGIVSSGHPYKTRLLVYRPASPERFSGTVFVEWTNVSNSFDNPIWWQRNHDYIMREGHAYVAVAAQHQAVHGEPDGLKHWNPERYGTLSVPDLDPDPDDPLFIEDHLSYDVFAQGLKAVRAVPEVMGGLNVQRLIAGGHSRSAMMLQVYINAIHPRAPIADGVMLLIQGGQVREDLEIPVMMILSESEFASFGGSFLTARQPDTDKFRTWWMSGASHADHQHTMIRAAIYRRDLSSEPLADDAYDPPTLSRIESHHMISAAMDAMANWVRDGVPPARSPEPEWTPGDPPALVRDQHGNVLGGIRLASLAVPVATSQGNNPGPYGYGGNHGVHVPFDTETLQSLYPSHEAYVQAFTDAAGRNVRDGFLPGQDAAEMIANTQKSLVGTGLASGPLCANVSNFLVNPSTSLLRDHTQVYHFRNGDRLLAILDEANRLVAEGYTAARQSDEVTKNDKFTKAAESLRRYIDEVTKMPAEGLAAQVTADLLTEFTGTLIEKITAEAK